MLSSSEYVLALVFVVALLLFTIRKEPFVSRGLPPSNGPYVIEISDFLSEADCDRLVRAGERKGLEESQVAGFKEDDPAYLDHESRKSEQTWFSKDSNPIADKMREKTKDFLKIFGLNPDDFEYEDVQFAKYKPGGYYKHHFDGDDCTDACPRNQRVATMLVYLREPIEGGETNFSELNKSVKPRKGKAVFFWVSNPNDRTLFKQTLHAGMPVKAGEKIIATQWVRTR